MTAGTVAPLNASRPVAANVIVLPQENTSQAAVTGSSVSCSGARYAGVPSSQVVLMPESSARAMPKSITTGPSGPRMTLPGLKSRCTTPWA
jgi:hypothetical protein